MQPADNRRIEMTATTETTIAQAVAEYLGRKDRSRHPKGTFDNAGRWYPADEEHRECCTSVRSPSRAYPYSYMTHCRSIDHVARLYGVDVAELRKAVRAARPPSPPKREGGEDYFKAVAVAPDGRMVSIYDGKTEYVVGKPVERRARQNHAGGIYVYGSADEAANADVPAGSAMHDAPRVVIRVRAGGQYCRYDSGKLSFSRVVPIEIVGQVYYDADDPYYPRHKIAA